MTRSFAIAIACAAGLTAGLAAAPGLAADSAHATLMGPDGAEMGTVTLAQSDKGVLVHVDATGLAAGSHGFHIHQTGACEPDFDAAGDHYNPDGKEHGFLSASGAHAGDMPNIFAGEDGTATADVFATMVSLDEAAPNTLFDDDGSAIIIHEKADSYGESAGAGGRVACGVIEPGM